MNVIFDPTRLQNFPTSPGVYLMKDKEGKILYVGKAKNLRARLKQYFIPGRDGRVIVPFLASRVTDIDTILVSSEKEALLLENNLIKQHQPKYNACLKDDKTFFSLMINHKHLWPMIRVVRYKGKPPAGNLYFGPYTYGHAARQTLELLRTLFPLRQCSDRELVSRTRPCILYEMKRCVAPCVSKCTKEEYDKYVDQVINFLRGHDATIIKELKKELEKAVAALEFEKAEQIHHTLQSISKTLQKQKVEKVGMGDLDVLGIQREGERVAIAQLLFREGKLNGLHEYLFEHNAQEDEEILSSFIVQNYTGRDFLPDEIVVRTEIKDTKTLEGLLKMAIAVPKKGTKKSLLKMAETNALAILRRKKEAKNINEQLLMSIEEALHLTHYPAKIECIDNSNISGTEPVSVSILFTEGKRDTKGYRKYKIKTAAPSDDYGALKEVLVRRFRRAKEEDNLPDMLLIDGGKGHLHLAMNVLAELDVSTVDLVAIAKESGKHTKGITREAILLPDRAEPIFLKPDSPVLFLLQQIRDEAHRFAITFQRTRRRKKSFISPLDQIVGIGPVKKKRLLLHFGSLRKIVEAPEEELLRVKGITKKEIERLRKMRNKE